MRTFLLFLFAAFAFIGCEDIQDNNPAMQAVLNNQLYKAIEIRAEILENGTLVLQGIKGDEELTITLNNSTEGIYTLGMNEISTAIYTDPVGTIYSTNPFGNGLVLIQNVSENTVSGTFKFNAYRSGLDTLNAQKGYFYRVPIINGTTTEETVPTVNLLSATIEGNPFSAQTITAANSNGFIVVNGTQDNQSIFLSFPNTIENGDNPIGEGIIARYILNGQTLLAVSGTISIVNHNTTINEISGTFSFETEGPDGLEITQGQFNVAY